MNERRLIVVSADALVYEDLDFASKLPNFGYALENGARIDRVRTIYPSLTHPVHASIMTGCPAGDTGVVSNERFVPGALECPWRNDLSEVKRETLFHAAHRAGLSTSACRWPVTARGGAVVDYLVPEVMAADMRAAETPRDAYRALGTSDSVMDLVDDALKVYGSGNAHPGYDAFEIACAAGVIRRFKPNLLMTHPGFIDGERHRTGLFTPAVEDALRVTDAWIGMLFDAARDAGIFESTDFVILSDHGHLQIERAVCVNAILAERGLLTVDQAGNLVDWRAYVASSGLSARVYLRDKSDAALAARVGALLRGMARDGLYGFERVFTEEETRARYGLYGDFSFILETDGFTTFSDDWRRPFVRPLDNADYRFGHSTDGHLPERGPQPPFIAFGPSFRKGAALKTGDILNHAPTFARVLGIDLPGARGLCETRLLAPGV